MLVCPLVVALGTLEALKKYAILNLSYKKGHNVKIFVFLLNVNR